MRHFLVSAILTLALLFYFPLDFLYANSLDALKQLQEINKALKRTIERMKEEGTLNQGDKKQVEERYKKIFQEELKKAKEESSHTFGPEVQDPFLEQGLQVCENMKKSKEELSASAGKKILAGAAAGAVIGAVAAGKDRRREGAIIGALVGVTAATAYELWNKRHFFEESPEKVAKRVNYSPEKGVYIKISKLEFDKTNYRDNENAKLIMRIELLTPDFKPKVSEEKNLLNIFSFKKGDAEDDKNNTTTQRFYDVKVEAYLVKENREIFIAEEKYSMPMGSYPFLYVFPMCPIIPKGTYELKFKVTYGETHDERVVSFEKI